MAFAPLQQFVFLLSCSEAQAIPFHVKYKQKTEKAETGRDGGRSTNTSEIMQIS